jgi:hypothetical protein
MISRRQFLRSAAAVTAGFGGLQQFVSMGGRAMAAAPKQSSLLGGYGTLSPRAGSPLDIPSGFECRVISATGQIMDDGFRVPGNPDGMGAFAAPEGRTIIVRNHELDWDVSDEPWAVEDRERIVADHAQNLYDATLVGKPCGGGTTHILYDTRTGQTLRQHLSLAGTLRNCAGGPTPWGSWISCEETTLRAGAEFQVDHGYNFEVPASGAGLLDNPTPLKAMGRFNHEAVAVDPASGIVYQTEDRYDAALYRFIPDVPGQLAQGGRLQCLALAGSPSADTRNWDPAFGSVLPGVKMPVVWIDAEDVESPEDDLRLRMFDKGAARFGRCEGMWRGEDAVYFACTDGGANLKGQIWRYYPSAAEGQPGEPAQPGLLELFIEPNNAALVDNCDNVTVAPWGDLIVCEDGEADQFVLGVTPEGNIYKLARNNISHSEIAGPVFSPDGSTLFLNILHNGLTLALTGPWLEKRAAAGEWRGYR